MDKPLMDQPHLDKSHMDQPHLDKPHIYRITIGAALDNKWSAWFNGMTLATGQDSAGQPATVLTGMVADQSALHGILAKIRDLGLTLISVTRLE